MMIIDPYRFGGSAPASISYLADYTPTIAGLVATSTGVGFGAVAARRLIIVAVHWTSTVSTSVLASATIGGVVVPTIISGSRIGSSAAGNSDYVAFIAAIVPTGTSGAVVATFGGGGSIGAFFFVHRAVNIISDTPFDTASAISASTPIAALCDLQADGVVVAAASCAGTPSPTSFTGATKVYEAAPIGTVTGANDNTLAAVSNASIQMLDPGSTSGAPSRTLLVASFR
ncbi:hypothetical protein [Mesorhizobium sp. B2-3-2]|uniref:hypothetical protein n=1 Tax=Mesorhizobium sp. B2-3-2 TaxID=2589961 RepID=UPI0011296A29|nr:hypothetical protein [Mesorhizobium sp. B2-3-2]TPM37051.1 hypothetical protein FJ964_30420 [Mesorhizobium sp. B2-3-2]